ncbi:uncharacterized protein A4U43_C04F9120 [Asparagus officinalis]|uniref:DNA (cytosine-5-)-methyltransferase n=1 Tax=Asparagus officinalis TaxID=4686 RepID=A0A5P1F186_ASPOF|nr:DNA (cytosine-5)-methyltransferase DRM2-like [Asparagus officinalis]XP_020260565.1 DNA (cytosine-5)-methyltransferase DRM2-like [Asparagus officinalis]ONK71483.1 uncharacterized protein A4U43_C04F9120 [Asparagus officinalis]
MDWVSDSDDDYNWDTHEADLVPASNRSAGPSNKASTSNSEEKHDSGDKNWDSDEGEVPAHDVLSGPPKEASEAGPSGNNWVAHFVAMGFPEELVVKAIKQNREGDTDGVLETLLTYGAIEKSPKREESPEHCSSASDEGILEDEFSDMEDFEFEDLTDDISEKDKVVSTLVDMGFLAEQASAAIDRCGPNASILELADSIHAAQMQEGPGDGWDCPAFSSDDENCTYKGKKRSFQLEKKKKRSLMYERKRVSMKRVRPNFDDDGTSLIIPNPMIGFSLPFKPPRITHRNLPEAAIGPPFFYYENVALAPKGVWETISRFLYDIEPEFVDSKFFCAAARKRGYIHNLPIKNRFPLLPIPPKTIHEVFPTTKKWWPSWDPRTHLNCLQTCIASAKLTERIRSALTESDGGPSERIKKWILYECRKWNLLWIGLNKVAPLEPDEVEMLLGFPRNHTRGISRTERYKSLGNSFQIDTVAYHLSVLKDMFPNGITVLSLFSGIGGGEVALHRLGIRIKALVSVELSDSSKNVVKSWWEQTNQMGTLIHISDVQKLDGNRLEQFIRTYGGFDLVIGGSPCNNLAGSNRHHRDGLEGEHSALFYDYFRILDHVKCLMGKN